ncbi:MAG: hypothetical protein R6U21_00385, partial [Thermoplasmatota archaeon]
MNKKNKIILLSVVILLILAVLGIYIYFALFASEDTVEKDTSETEIDDRISPLTNQAVFFKVQRIRKKGIIDHMNNAGLFNNLFDINNYKITSRTDLIIKNAKATFEGLRPGIGWKEKPIFNYICTLDGYEHTGDVDFKTWDTGYINHHFFRNVKENISTVDVEFTIIEVENNFLGNKRLTKEIDNFEMTYDFRTGRWTGDDYFNDSDGYGHLNTTTYEVWFEISQTDYDNDGIPWWTEVNVLGTNPKEDDRKLDHDNDGCSTAWEWKWGYDPFTWNNHTFLDPDNDGLQNVEEEYMSKWQANPYTQDMYIEVDWMEKTPFKPFIIETRPGRIFKSINRPMIVNSRLKGWEHVFYDESQQMIMERFNEHGITVHFDDGCMGGGGDELPFAKSRYETEDRIYLDHAIRNQDNGFVSEFYYNNFADERKGIFRYAVIAHGGGWCHPQDIGHGYDYMIIPTGKDFTKGVQCYAWTQRTRRISLAVGLFHELGHSLGFHDYEGVDNCTARAGDPPDYPWFDYVTVMNYDYYQLRYFDYSDGSNGPPYDRNDWAFLDVSHFQEPSESMEGIGAGVVFD